MSILDRFQKLTFSPVPKKRQTVSLRFLGLNTCAKFESRDWLLVDSPVVFKIRSDLKMTLEGLP